MTDLDHNPVTALKAALLASTALVASLEGAVSIAQEKLRRELTKIEKTRELIALFEPEQSIETSAQPNFFDGKVDVNGTPRDTQKAQVAMVVKATARPDSKKAKLARAITSLLSLRGSVHRTDILAHLQGSGLMGQERDPIGQLAAFLSGERDKFVSDGRGNFSLRASSVASERYPSSGSDEGNAGVDDAATSSATP